MKFYAYITLVSIFAIVAVNASCNDTYPPCSGYGSCDVLVGRCLCDGGHVGDDCSYPMKSRRAAFAVHFLFGVFGAGNYYLGNISFATGEVFLTLAAILIRITVMREVADANISLREKISIIIMYRLVITGVFVWWLTETVLIGTGQRRDRDGVATYDNL